MEYGFSILMFIFSGAILLYALLLGLTKDIKLIPRNYAVKIKNKKRYAVQFAKITAVVSIAPALTGAISLFTQNIFCIIGMLILSFILCIRAGIRFFNEE